MTLRLPRLTVGDVQVKSWANKLCDAIERQEGTQDSLIAGLAAAVAAIEVVLGIANGAAATATAAARELARINSYTDPSVVVSAADAGTDATITIAAHTRIYPVQGTIDVPDVVIPAPVDLTGLAFSTLYAVYYDDLTLADTTPTYVSTTDLAAAAVGAAPGRHFVGTITTPADGGGGTTGGGGTPPGGGGGEYLP